MYMESQCTNDGAMRLTVTFKLGTNPDMAQVLVQNRVAIATPKLPGGRPPARRRHQEAVHRHPAGREPVREERNRRRPTPEVFEQQLAVSRHANLQVKDELARIDGVGDVFLFGNRDYAMRVWLDPEKMTDLNLVPSEVVDAIRKQNVQVAGRADRPAAGPTRAEPATGRQHPGPAQDRAAVPGHRGQDRAAGRGAGAARRRGPRRTRGEELRLVQRARQPPVGRHADLPAARRRTRSAPPATSRTR